MKNFSLTCLVKLTASFSVNLLFVLTSSNSSPPSINSMTIKTLGLKNNNNKIMEKFIIVDNLQNKWDKLKAYANPGLAKSCFKQLENIKPLPCLPLES